MNNPVSYLTEIQLALINSAIISEFQIIRTWVNTDVRYITIKCD